MLGQELEIAHGEINGLRTEVTDLESRVQTLISEKNSLDHEMLTLKDILATKKSELDRDSRAREKLEQTLRSAMDAATKKDAEVIAKLNEVKQLRETIGKLEGSLKEERIRVEKAEKEKDHLSARLGRLQQEYDEQVLTTTRLLSENQQQTGELKGWEEELGKYKEELRSATRVKDSLSKRIKVLEDLKLEAEVERDQLRVSFHLS